VIIELEQGQHVTCTFRDARSSPDASISLDPAGPYSGDNVYASSPSADQTLLVSGVEPGAIIRYWVRIGNDSVTPGRFTLDADATGDAAIQVRYLLDERDRTADLRSGRYVTPALEPGGAIDVQVQVHVAEGSAADDVKVVLVRATSVKDPDAIDMVRARIERALRPPSDGVPARPPYG
jgi:hypothetical protein